VPPPKVDPIVDLVPAAGLVWLIEARPREMLANQTLGAAITTLVDEDRFEVFAQHHGLDLRQARQVAIAGYPATVLGLAFVSVDPPSVERAFAARALGVEGRAVEHGVTRFWGTAGGAREQVALFARAAVGVERGRLGPLNAAVYFAQGRLKRALPALEASPLAAAAKRLGAAPLRGFAPGPFQGDLGGGLGGLLAGATAVGASVRPTEGKPGASITLRLILTGAWGQDAPAAADRLAAWYQVLVDDPLGHLTGADRPLSPPEVTADASAVGLDVELDGLALARGLHAATGATLAEIMAF
jgi:hypothetical protein